MKVVTILRPAMIGPDSASLLVARNPREYDYSMKDPYGIVRAIPNMTPLSFDALSTFKIHPFKRLLCSGDPGVNSTIKSAKIYP